MKTIDQVEDRSQTTAELVDSSPLRPLVLGRRTSTVEATLGGVIVVGELIGITDQGRTPLVIHPCQSGSAAIPARSVVDLQGAQVGKQVVLAFDQGDSNKPIVMGVIQDARSSDLQQRSGSVEVDTDGARMIVTAKQQLVLRCGHASITLTRAGKILIEGTYVSSRSSGVIRIKGGSVQVN